MITNEEARIRVARGAAHLDQVRPGWWDRIDVGLLAIDSCQTCVAAQLVTGRHDYPFSTALIQLGLVDTDPFSTRIADHGMGLKSFEAGARKSEDTSFRRLQDAWIDAIADRRLRSQEAQEAPQAVNAVAKG